MIGGRIMAWFQRLRGNPDAHRQLDALMAVTLAASEDATKAADDLRRSARRDRIKTRWVARQAERRAAATQARRGKRQALDVQQDVEAVLGRMLSEVGRGKGHDGRH